LLSPSFLFLFLSLPPSPPLCHLNIYESAIIPALCLFPFSSFFSLSLFYFIFRPSRVGLGNQAIKAMRDGILQAVEPYVEVECTEAVEVKKKRLSPLSCLIFAAQFVLLFFTAQFYFFILLSLSLFSLCGGHLISLSSLSLSVPNKNSFLLTPIFSLSSSHSYRSICLWILKLELSTQ
jgi:hypothetical protein